MNDLYEYLSQLQSASLEPFDGKPFLHERFGELSLHFEQETIQSRMRRRAPDALVLGYTKAMMSFLLFHPAPARIAMLGLGGGSLAKYCLKYLPSADFTAVEINPDVIAFRSKFAIPPDGDRFRVICGDGADFIRDSANVVDILLIDAFDVSGQPRQLCSQEFYELCYARLGENGVLVANLWTGDVEYGACISRIRRAFRNQVVSVMSEDPGNKIVFACKGAGFPPPAHIILCRARSLNAAHQVDFLPTADAILDRIRAQAVRMGNRT